MPLSIRIGEDANSELLELHETEDGGYATLPFSIATSRQQHARASDAFLTAKGIKHESPTRRGGISIPASVGGIEVIIIPLSEKEKLEALTGVPNPA